MSELLDRAREIYNGLPIADLKAAGIWPAPDYELVFNYPPYQVLGPIEPAEIFPEPDRVKEKRKVAVYVHIPFCQSICAYCHYTRRRCTPMDIDDYLVCGLWLELELMTRLKEMMSTETQSLHVGGGTPSLLSMLQLDKLQEILARKLGLPPRIETTIEANPATVSERWLFIASGVFNRLNIGIQSFEDHLLNVCHRPYNRQQAINAIKMAKAAGFENINIDLIFGLPGQSFEDWHRTLETAVELDLASITCYKLRRKEATSFGKMADTAFPSPEDQLVMHIMAIEALTDAGYLPWHFETLFVRDPKFSHQHQDHKWQGLGELLGLGVSAYSYINDYVYHNTSLLDEYYESIRNDRLPIKVGQHLDETEQKHRWMVLGLLRLRVEQEPFFKRFGKRPSDVFGSQLEPLVKLGLVEVTNEKIRITRYPGLLFIMEILTKFYSQRVSAILASKGLSYGSFPVR